MNFDKIIKFLKDLIAPKKCVFCNTEGTFLCETCKEKINTYSPFCFVCSEVSNNYKIHKSCNNKENFLLDRVIVFTHYKNKEISKLIKDAKYYLKRDIFEDFAIYLADLLKNNIKLEENKIMLTYAPMHKKKQRIRGYNQAEILAKHIGKILNIEVLELVNKTANTKAQAESTGEERKNNLNKAFEINKKYVKYVDAKKIVIIDDVITTGSTLNEISKVIQVYNPEEIIGLTIASG